MKTWKHLDKVDGEGDNDGGKITKKDVARGERSGGAKITESQVIEMRQIYSSKTLSQNQLAERYGIDQASVWRIVNNKTWKHI